MGVKDLWQVLAPVCERKSLWELQDKAVAIDLSGWVCDSQNIVEHSSQPNMHLRNLFFRTSCLLLLGARPVFVLEGDAPDLKLNVMSQRNTARGLSQSSKNSGKRTRYKGIQKKVKHIDSICQLNIAQVKNHHKFVLTIIGTFLQCQEMLRSMGVHCVQSVGEAEAMCALLNAKGVVHGCISQDSDCFLYGGQVVYRNFTISATSGGGGGPGFSIDMYRMEQVEEVLGLSRTKLIGLSLLCGCDYNQGGVSGVGKETAVKFLATLKDEEVFLRFSRWRSDPVYEQLEKERSYGVCDRCCHLGKKRLHDKNGCELCGTTKSCHITNDPNTLIRKDPDEQKMVLTELNIRKKALQDKNFPSKDLIDEFSCVGEVPEHVPLEWSQPNLIGFMKLAEKQLNWDECYSVEKFLPLLTRWLIVQKKTSPKCPIYPETILKTRVLKGVASYEVKWTDKEGLFNTLITEENSNACVTIEPRDLFDKAFPEIVQEFNEKEAAKKAAKLKGKSKATRSAKVPRISPKCSDCGRDLPAKNQSCLCHFIKISAVENNEKSSKPNTLEDLLDKLSLNSEPLIEEKKEPLKTKLKSSKIKENCEKLKRLLGENTYGSLGDHTSDSPQIVHQSDVDSKESCLSDPPNSPTPTGVDNAAKFSFEDLLENEKWTVDDFTGEEEGDLSDIVQSITGKSTTLYAVNKHEEIRASTFHASKEGTFGLIATPELPSKPKREDSFDEETPYTPLIDRVRKMCENKTQEKRSSATASLKLRRFSESFDVFCIGEAATSSPISSCVSENASLNGSNNLPNVTFSLGITKLLENSN